MKQPEEGDLLVEFIRELTAEVRLMGQRIRERLRDLERIQKQLRDTKMRSPWNSNEPKRKPLADGSPG
jgi:hypothetical protein